jgi:hypothetical protein
MLLLLKALKPTIRELKVVVKQVLRLILSNLIRILLVVYYSSIALKLLDSNCLSNLPSFFKFIKKYFFHLIFSAL